MTRPVPDHPTAAPETDGGVRRGGAPITRVLYNEIDPYAAQWLRNLSAEGHIAPGRVDTCSIVDLRPSDLDGVAQFHAFAGIGGWSLALRLAGIPDDFPIWTGSCPCQPFSAAGRRAGFADERHLWPAWFRLIRECRPAVVAGEQVEAAVRLGWLDAVFADLESEGYACGAAVLGAHSVGAPHIRLRTWFVAYADEQRQGSAGDATWSGELGRRGEADGVADPAGERQHRSELARAAGAPADRGAQASERWAARLREPARRGAAFAVADVLGARLEGRHARSLGLECATAERGGAAGAMGDAKRVGLARQSMSALGAMLGAKLEGATGAGVGYVAGKGLEKLSGARNAAQARRLFAGEAPTGMGERLRAAGVGVRRVAAPQMLPNVARLLLPPVEAPQ